jgi:hypothetical protein
MSETTEPTWTMACPICAWPEPHSHTAEEIADRPAIDWARLAFEKQAPKLMLSPVLKPIRTGFSWIDEAHLARWKDEYPGGKKYLGWAAREHPSGPYSDPFVQTMWLFWREAWMAARLPGWGFNPEPQQILGPPMG